MVNEQLQTYSIISCLQSIWKNRHLVYQMTKREVLGKYKGSTIGILWSFIIPILMLIVYTFVFSVVFKARWGDDENGTKTQFALILFVGLIIYNFLAECLLKSPSLIMQHNNYVKKVIFPLELLPIIAILSVLFNTLVSFFVLIIAFLLLNGYVHITILWIPLVLLPLIILSLGLMWLISSLGVYIRDIGQVIGVFVTMLMFLSPIFYPISALPLVLQKIVLINPLAYIIEQSRLVIITGVKPDIIGLCIYAVLALMFSYICYCWFQKVRKGFADVI